METSRLGNALINGEKVIITTEELTRLRTTAELAGRMEEAIQGAYDFMGIEKTCADMPCCKCHDAIGPCLYSRLAKLLDDIQKGKEGASDGREIT